LAFAKEGSNVVVGATKIEDCRKVSDKCETLGNGKAMAVAFDATKLEPCEALVKKTLERFKRIDVLVVSIGWNRLASFLELDPKDWDWIIATNYTATLNLFKVVLPVMIRQKGGNIVTMSSIIGRKGDPHEPVYGGLKAGQINLTHSLAMEMAPHGIRLNVVAPALTMPENLEETSSDSVWRGAFSPEDQKALLENFEAMTPMGRIAKPIDVAHAVLFFASDVMSGHVTGNLIGTDGGIYMTR
jgi:NAD(P)-dependent dehydrogenase (short-subunit alcohol dehydrogenase family)